MSDDKPKKPAPAPAAPAAPATAPAANPTAAKPAASAGRPQFDERRFTHDELAPLASQLDGIELVAMLNDGRAIVRANSATAIGVVGGDPEPVVPLVRDSEQSVALAAAQALAKLGPRLGPALPKLVAALDGTSAEVDAVIVPAIGSLIGVTDDHLIAALDVPTPLVLKSVVAAARALGARGVAFLVRAASHDRSRIRINAVIGLGEIGKLDITAAVGLLEHLEQNDPIPDVRTAAKQSKLKVVAREKTVAVDHLPKNIPDFEVRKLARSELSEYQAAINVDEMIFALHDGRAVVKINASRALAVVGSAAGRAGRALGLILRDTVAAVRREAALALGQIGPGAIEAAAELVHALGDREDEVSEAASDSLTGLGIAAQDALLRGLEVGEEAHGLRVGALIGRLPRADQLLANAMASPAVNVQVNAALGLGLLRDRVGVGLDVLLGARTGGDARTRDAVRRALDMIVVKPNPHPQAVTIDGFEERVVPAAEFEKAKPAVERVGVADLIKHLSDGRDIVRTNAATALGTLGSAATPAATALGVRLRDDVARVRLAAATALERIGDPACLEVAHDIVGALRDSEERVAVICGGILRARKGRVVGALVRGLETDDPRHGRRINEVIAALPDAAEILVDAFASAAVNVQVNAAQGLGSLGNRVGRGRRALEGARTGGDARTREAVRTALAELDGPRRTGPGPVAVEGFEDRILGHEAFGDGSKLRADDLVEYLRDGRPIVRANAASGLGALGSPMIGAVAPLAALLRDDDMRVRIAVTRALDKIGDDAVREAADHLVGALRGDGDVAAAVASVLGARKTRVQTALVKGLETDDPVHAARIIELIAKLPDPADILCDAIESPAENVQVNAAIGIGMLGAKRAGPHGRRALESRRTGGFVRTREAAFKGLGLLDSKQ